MPEASSSVRKNHDQELFLPLVLIGFATIMALVTTLEGAAFRFQRGDQIDLPHLLSGRLIDWYSCALMVPALYWVTVSFPIERGRWQRALPIHLMATSCAAALKLTIYVSIRGALEPDFDRTFGNAIASDFLGKSMFYWAVTAALHAIVFYRREETRLSEPSHEKACAPHPVCDWLPLSSSRTGSFLRLEEIDWIEAQGNYALIHAGDERHLVRETMGGLLERLPSSALVRVHRSAIVNFASVRAIEAQGGGRYRLTLKSGATVSSGRSYARALRGLLP